MTARLLTVSRDFSLTCMHSKDVKLATEESTGFNEVLHHAAAPVPICCLSDQPVIISTPRAKTRLRVIFILFLKYILPLTCYFCKKQKHTYNNDFFT